MKKFFYFTLFLFTVFRLDASAQKLTYGAHVGINFSGYHVGNEYQVYDEKAKTGYNLGADLCYHLGSNIMLLSGVDFSQSGGKFSTMSPYISTTGNQATEFKEVNTKVLSFEIPVKIGCDIKVSNNFSIIPNAGLFARYAVASIKGNVITADGEVQKWKSTDDYDKDSHHIDAFKRFDYGVIGGVNMIFANHYTFSASYKEGLKKIQSQYDMKTWSANLSVGYRW
jgi:hypothetical protein